MGCSCRVHGQIGSARLPTSQTLSMGCSRRARGQLASARLPASQSPPMGCSRRGREQFASARLPTSQTPSMGCSCRVHGQIGSARLPTSQTPSMGCSRRRRGQLASARLPASQSPPMGCSRRVREQFASARLPTSQSPPMGCSRRARGQIRSARLPTSQTLSMGRSGLRAFLRRRLCPWAAHAACVSSSRLRAFLVAAAVHGLLTPRAWADQVCAPSYVAALSMGCSRRARGQLASARIPASQSPPMGYTAHGLPTPRAWADQVCVPSYVADSVHGLLTPRAWADQVCAPCYVADSVHGLLTPPAWAHRVCAPSYVADALHGLLTPPAWADQVCAPSYVADALHALLTPPAWTRRVCAPSHVADALHGPLIVTSWAWRAYASRLSHTRRRRAFLGAFTPWAWAALRFRSCRGSGCSCPCTTRPLDRRLLPAPRYGGAEGPSPSSPSTSSDSSNSLSSHRIPDFAGAGQPRVAPANAHARVLFGLDGARTPTNAHNNPASGTDVINKSIDKLGFPTHFDMFLAHSMPSPSPTLRPRPQSHVTPRTWRVCATSAFLFRVADVPSLGCLRRGRGLLAPRAHPAPQAQVHVADVPFTGSLTPRAWAGFVSSHTSPTCCLGSAPHAHPAP
ncbi:hypothetical protein C8J57DRAFT_1517431 [Mycena rebaudengoi]|nr:hypothetical protein C8J57DRAFT_1517431 [Mycena rebaudengoi]